MQWEVLPLMPVPIVRILVEMQVGILTPRLFNFLQMPTVIITEYLLTFNFYVPHQEYIQQQQAAIVMIITPEFIRAQQKFVITELMKIAMGRQMKTVAPVLYL